MIRHTLIRIFQSIFGIFMLAFCPPNQTLSQPWIDNGLHRCFTSTISCILISIVSLIPFITQIAVYYRHGTLFDANLRSKSRLFYLQVSITCCIPFSIITGLFVHAFTTGIAHIYGYIILELAVLPLIWITSLLILHLERTRYVLRPTGKGHGIPLLLFWFVTFITSFLPLVSIGNPLWWWSLRNYRDVIEFSIWLVQTCFVTIILIIGIKAPGLPDSLAVYQRLEEESRSENDDPNRGENVWARRYRRFKLILPYISARGYKLIQLRIAVCALLLVVARLINLYTPILYKEVVDSLTPASNTTWQLYQPSKLTSWLSTQLTTGIVGVNGLAYRWDLILLFVAARLLQGSAGIGGGLIGAIRSQFWIAVDQFSTRELSVALFSHIQNLSMRWHLSRKTGEMLRVVDRGTASISSVLSYIAFNIVPTIVDILIGVGYFVGYFNVWYGLIIFATMVVYLVLTIIITEWRAKFRREMNKLDNQKNTRAVDALLNFETVKYYNAEQFETDRFKTAFVNYQRHGWSTLASLNLLNTVQNGVISLGVLAGTLLCARDIVQGRLTVGDFVLFIAYTLQLYAPLNFFGTYYRMLQASLIDMENMFDLLDEGVEIKDDPDARPLITATGEVEFRDVSFHYTPERPILQHVSFKIPAGKSVALVGESGAGKSTIIRLLFRFYNTTDGSILIDGQDISRVTQSTLRQTIGVVPQDTVLFNTTILDNIRYGRQSASDDEVREAAMIADIHQRIVEFPQSYETQVGERGLKLSGGEKQRVAIARTVLKNPLIVVLDEATSALDTATERNIQASLTRIAANRTTLIVAHRLSTVINADEILVMHRGEIVERGKHDELLATDGRYAQLWRQQTETASDLNGVAEELLIDSESS